MFTCYLLDGEACERQFEDLAPVVAAVERSRRALYEMELDAVIDILARLGRALVRDPAISGQPGVTYIALWLRRDNLERICRLNYGDPGYLGAFREFEGYCGLAAQPRGIVCHWIAGNIPTLAFFSVAQCILSRNGSLVKVPVENRGLLLAILGHLKGISIERGGKQHTGDEILRSIAVLSFEGRDLGASEQFSLAADCKMLWGSSEAIRAIAALPQKEHCDVITFGPKYSFGAFDRASIEGDGFDRALEAAARDAAVFNQMACSSPHVYFFEKSRYSLEEIADRLQKCFEALPPKLLAQPLPPAIAARVINARGRYLLADGAGIRKPAGLGWTILINRDLCLEEPVQGRCVFLKEVEDVEDVLPLLTRKVQALSVAIRDPAERERFALEASYRGVDRIVAPGKMHDFDLPWDGYMTLNRLVRWALLKT